MFKKIIKTIMTKFEKKLLFEDIKSRNFIWLYAGDIPNQEPYNLNKDLVGLSINKADYRTIFFDITNRMPLDDNSVDVYQAEDVFEHIDISKIPDILDEIYRVLKPSGYFRLSVPDYRAPYLRSRALYKENSSEPVFDYGGGGFYNGSVCGGGHVWFPTYKIIKDLLNNSKFSKIDFIEYFDDDNIHHENGIDYSKGYIQRDFKHDPNGSLSIIVDCYKL